MSSGFPQSKVHHKFDFLVGPYINTWTNRFVYFDEALLNHKNDFVCLLYIFLCFSFSPLVIGFSPTYFFLPTKHNFPSFPLSLFSSSLFPCFFQYIFNTNSRFPRFITTSFHLDCQIWAKFWFLSSEIELGILNLADFLLLN